METLTPKTFRFGEFELDVVRRSLYRDGEQVALNSRAFDLLLELVMRRGEILSKDALLEKVWDGQFVEEGNLTVHISALRKIFGEKKDDNRFIATVPGRGYSFVSELRDKSDADTIIASHSFTKIVVEEQITEPDNDSMRRDESLALAAKSRFTDWLKYNAVLAAGLVVAFVVVLGVGAYLLRNSIANKSVVPFSQMSIKRLTTKGNVGTVAISHDGKLFAYSNREGERESLWLAHVDGGEPIEIRPPADLIYLDLKFTPDGSSIYYSVNETYGNGRLYKMPVFGGAAEKIRDNIRSFSFAPDGRRFAFVQSDQNEGKTYLMTANSTGGDEQKTVVLPTDIISLWGALAWSPDGLTIMLIAAVKSEDRRLYVVNMADGKIRPFTEFSWRSAGGLSWLKDGSGLIAVGLEKNSLVSQIWFVSYPNGETRRAITDLNEYGYVTSVSDDNSLVALQGVNQSNIWVGPADDLGQAKQITFDSAGRNDGWYGVAWTPDQRIVYSADTKDSTTLWTMNADGSKQKQLIPSGGVNNYPSLTSDGSSVIFQSNRGGHFGVWRADLNGENMMPLTGDTVAGWPSVSPDGKWIVYSSNIDSNGELWRISASGGEPFRLADNPSGWAMISPDSKMVACSFTSEGRTKIVILSLDDGKIITTFEISRLANVRLGVHWTPDGKAVTYRDWTNGIWRQELSGGEPQRLKGLPEEKLFAYGWSPDGKWFAYTRGSTTRDVVLISNSK